VSRPGRVARTRRIDHLPDPVAFAGHDGVLFAHPDRAAAGVGVALRLPVTLASAAQAAADALGDIDRESDVDLPGTGPIALGAFPFAPGAPGELVVPRLTVGRAPDGTCWVTTVDPDDDERDPLQALGQFDAQGAFADAMAARPISPGACTVTAERDPADWCGALEAARDALVAAEHHKVVLARGVRVTAESPFDRAAVLGHLARSYPSCHLFGMGGFIGASPELLVSRLGDVVRSHPMAGTAPRSADPSTDALLAASLLASAKDREEHQITIDMVHDTLLGWCSYLDWEPEPRVVAMANVQHLATRMEGRLHAPAAPVLELVAALHPTPAVGGHPRDAALALIDRLEGLDRGWFAGPVGWCDAEGNGEWAVGIRSAHLDGTVARCFAGVGVVADSDPSAELEETRTKLQALLSALVRP
jgi:isochorismate synthase